VGRAAGRFVKRVLETIARHSMVDRGDIVVAAVSGGPDSVAMFYALLELREPLGFELAACHLDHGFRGPDSAADAEFVARMCAAEGVRCEVSRRDVPALMKRWGVGAEEAGRRARYEFYEEIASKLGATRVALGHTMDDQAETVLMRLLRGSGSEGLGGIPPVRDIYIRPLLFVSRRDVEAYCAGRGLATRTDATNLEPRYFRNQIRLQAIPFLERWNPRIRETLAAMSDMLRDDAAYMEAAAKEAMDGLVAARDGGFVIDLAGFMRTHAALRRRLVRIVSDEVLGRSGTLGHSHVEAVLDLAGTGRTGAVLHLPGGLVARKEAGGVIAFEIGPSSGMCRPAVSLPRAVRVPGRTVLPEMGMCIEAEVIPRDELHHPAEANRDPRVAYVDFGLLAEPITVRSRADGDFFYPLGLGGKKKVGDFLTSAKVPIEERSRVPIVLAGDDIVWVGGHRIDDRFKVSRETRDVLVLRLLPGTGA
jgi:tRNA(Ile)-lysidine synthase